MAIAGGSNGKEGDWDTTGGGKEDEDALSILTLGLGIGFVSHFSNTSCAKRSNTSTIAVFLPQENPAFSIMACNSSLSIFTFLSL